MPLTRLASDGARHPLPVNGEREEDRARELARWTRPNAHHFVRPDWRRHVARGSELAAYFENIERKYRPDHARVPAGDPGGGQWTEEEGSGEGTARPTSAGDSAGSERVDPAQFRSEQRRRGRSR